jgi:hypothetical protein
MSLRFVVTVQRRFRTVFGREPPTKMSVYKWYKLFDQTGCICKGEKGKAPRDDQSLNLRWIQFVQLSFAVHTNQPGMVPDS